MRNTHCQLKLRSQAIVHRRPFCFIVGVFNLPLGYCWRIKDNAYTTGSEKFNVIINFFQETDSSTNVCVLAIEGEIY